MPHPALRAGATTLHAPDALLCSANYVGAEVAQIVFAMPQGAIVLLDASSSLALHVLAVPPATWSLPAGICIDGEHEQVVVLDAAGPSFLRLDLADLRAGKAKFKSTPLRDEWSTVRGIAFDFARDRIVGFEPTTGQLLQQSATDPGLNGGTLQPVPEVLAFGFAPIGNLDHDLFISSGDVRMLTSQWTWNEVGEVDVESATLRATVATSSWSPPSPDPSSVTFDSFRDRLIISDGEVDEMSIYNNGNVFESSRAGVMSRRTTTTAYSREPVGISFQNATKTFYISDDDQRRVHVITAGADGLIHTSDDTRRSFSVSNFTTDPEDVAFSNATNELWIAGGDTNKVHRLRPGSNGIFDGTSPNGDDQLLTVTVSTLGVSDPEGIGIRAVDGGVYVVGMPKTTLLHLNASGQFVRTISLPSTGLRKPAGLVFAPRSSGTGDSMYLVDRGVDNDSDPGENDGRMFEYGVPGPTPTNTAPIVNAGPDVTTLQTVAASLAGTATDDGLPGGTLVIQWTKLSGPGTVTFTTPTQAVTNATFSLAGSYTLQLSANDGALSATDTVAVTVQTPPAGSGQLNLSIVHRDDDAEELPGSVARTSTDLELVVDGTVSQTVGLRYRNLTIPAGYYITSAYLQFTTDAITTTPTQLTIAGQATDNPPTFGGTAGNISTRPRTTATVAWTPASWSIANEAGANQRTPNLRTVVQEIVSRPGWVSGNAMVFVITGTGTRTASAFDRAPAVSPKLIVNYQSSPPVNQAPVVSAGPDTTTLVTSSASLSGTVTDDGLPGGPLTMQWTKVSGPGTASFTTPNQAATNVSFSLAGSYTLQLSANDGALASTDTVVVTVTLPVNQAPVVDAGPDLTILLTSSASLAGTATDDGWPAPLTIQWTKVSGPGTVTFTTPAQAATNATFSLAGSYTLQLSASDSEITRTDTVVVTVQTPPPASGTFERAIANSDDDAEEAPGSVNRTSTDLELVVDGAENQTVGLRFQNVAIPVGSFVTSAYVQFTTDETSTTPTELTIAGHATDNAPTFTATAGNISSRPRTTATVAWAPASWTVGNEAGPNQRTPNLRSIVQEITNRAGWGSGNAIAFVITGTGSRIASAWDDDPAVAPKLVVTYQSTPPPNQAPVVNAGPDTTISVTMAAQLAATVTDDGWPNGLLTIQWSKIAGPGVATFTAPTSAATNVTFSLAGSYTLQCSGNDGALSTSDTLVVTVLATGVNQPPVVNAGSDVTITLPAAASLAGTVTDDNLLGPVTIQWTKVSGPGTATFSAPTSAATNVTLSLAGSYTLQLSAFDGEHTRTDTVTVTALQPNLAPNVNAGPDLTVAMPTAAHLAGTVTDDGVPGGPLTIQWSKLTGPGTVTFTAPTSAITDASFSAAGIYTLRLSGSDGLLTRTDSVTVTVD
ncbi:MAG TPA: hypothetical protein VF384_08015, partial [Planctomycetota bacterium]